jgi:ABC-2 type transport system ATP-binding protein
MEKGGLKGAKVDVTEAIRCEDLSKHFGRFVALAGLSLGVGRGGVFGLLGPNGAGKTTTLRLFTGLTHPTSGRVWVAGEEVSHSSLRLRSRVGYLPESPAFYGWMTGREFLRYVGELYGLSPLEAGRRAGELLEQVHLSEAADRRVRTYSRGMSQRLGLAQALVCRPEVLFLDEPASALDPMGRRDMLETIARLRGQTTIFVSTHILSDVERVCDHAAIINRGRLVAAGSISELRSQRRPVFELEFDEGGESMRGRLAGISWVKSVDYVRRGSRQVIRVELSEVQPAKREMPRLVYESGLMLRRLELVEASLEDVFMELMEKEEVSA